MAKKLMFLNFFLYTLMCIIIFIIPLHSQTNGKIAGRVIDKATEDPLPGVNVFVKGTYLGSATDLNGYYIIVNVPPGVYDVEASIVGYKAVVKTEVLVSLERTSAIEFELEEATLEGEVVMVVAERDILHKEVSSSQQVITPVEIENAAGVNTINDFIGSQAGIQDASLLTIRGGSAEQTGTLVNGLSFVNQRIGKAEATIPISAVEQVSMNAGGYNAEYGNFRSGIINVTTKSGDKNAYHMTFDYSQNNGGMKRFGKSLYDPNNYYLQSYFDPILAFEGTSPETWAQVIGDPENLEEGEYLEHGHDTFRGWNFITTRYNRGLDPEEQATPMDLYLYNAWMHMIVPDFDKLEELYPELTTDNPTYNNPDSLHYQPWEKIKEAIREHAHEKEGKNSDYNIDLGFGGPIPFFHKHGDATFYVSHKTTNFNYIQPVVRDGEKNHITMLSIKSNVTKDITVKIHGLYRQIYGSQSNFPTDGDIPNLELGGDTMPINNLGTLIDDTDQANGGFKAYAYHPTFWQPKDQTAYLTGLTINNVVNPATFWDLTLSYAYQHDLFEPKETRNHDFIINFGPFYLNEMPYGITFASVDRVAIPGDTTYWSPIDEFEAVYSMTRRHASKVGQFHENSVTQQFKFKFDLSNQYNRYHFFKTGVELNYFDINNDLWDWWQGHDTIYEMRDRRKPYQLGGYIQDQISLEGMEARIGVRFDYYNSGGGLWPSGDNFNVDAFWRGTERDNETQLYEDLVSGKSVVWERWRAVDSTMGGTFLEKTKNHFTVSPRIGVAFPITERSKFWFNYGHFRQPVPYSQQFMYKQRFAKQGLFDLGNPNLEPPRTISYELGVSYNLLDQYLISLSTYYKDVTGESATISYNEQGNLVHYDSWLNNRWEDDQGFELRINKNVGTYFTGWFNFWYVIDKNGRVGSLEFNEVVNDNDESSLYGGDENSPSLSPKIAANLSFHTPTEFGPQTLGFFPFGGWNLSMLPVWDQGDKFQFNPRGIRNLDNNLQWPDYYKMDLKLSKAFEIYGVNASIYLDVRNVFNTKINWMHNEWAFSSDADRTEYLASLHLPQYKDKTKYPEEYVAGNDKVGDLRSDKKPYINDPDVKMFLYGFPRDIWFGLRLNF